MEDVVSSVARIAGSAIASVARWIAVELLWHLVLFSLGRAAIWLVTLGRLPSQHHLRRYPDRISLAGALVLLLAWAAIAIYNNVQVAAHAV